MWSWLLGRIIQPFLPYVLGGLLCLSVVSGLAGLWKGYQWASAACQAANDAAEVKAKEATLERYRALLRATELQRATEAARAADTASALQQRAQELEADKASAEAAIVDSRLGIEGITETVAIGRTGSRLQLGDLTGRLRGGSRCSVSGCRCREGRSAWHGPLRLLSGRRRGGFCTAS